MPNTLEIRHTMRQLADRAKEVAENRALGLAAKRTQLDVIERQMNDCREAQAVADQAARWASGGDALGAGELAPDCYTATASGRVRPIQLSNEDLHELHSAALSKKSLRITTKTGADDLVSALPVSMQPTVQRIIEPTRVASLLPTATTELPVIEYPRIVGVTGSATVVPPGGTKPAVVIDTDTIEARVAKIAATTTVNDESLQDFPNFSALITSELQKVIIEAENVQLLVADGTGTNMLGLLNTPGLLTQAPVGTDTNLDVVERAVTALRTGPSFAVATGIIMHPTDWSNTRRTKDGYQRYLVAPDPTRDAAESLWGVPVISTTTCPVGTAIVGHFGIGAALHVRRGLVIELSNQAGDNFQTNRCTFRIELREVLAVMRPTAFVNVTLNEPTG